MKMKKSDVVRKWTGEQALKSLYPQGADIPPLLRKNLMMLFDSRKVLEIGCGDGRLAPLFHHGMYTGIDINGAAVDAARKNHPMHSFVQQDWDVPYPDKHDGFLFYTVLLHVPDDLIPNMVSRIRNVEPERNPDRLVVVVECMDAGYRMIGPDFQRTPEAYDLLFNRWGFAKVFHASYGPNCPMTLLAYNAPVKRK